MLYNVVFWQSSTLTDKILKSSSKLSACRFWSVSVKSSIISRRRYCITVGKIQSILKISVRTTENTTTIPHGFGIGFFFLWGGLFFFVLCMLGFGGFVLVVWLVCGFSFFKYNGMPSYQLMRLQEMHLQIILPFSRHSTKMHHFSLLKFYASLSLECKSIKTGFNYAF